MCNEKLFVFKSLQVNLGHFISQIFISVLGNYYLFSAWKKKNKQSIFAFHGVCSMLQPFCNLMQTKTL